MNTSAREVDRIMSQSTCSVPEFARVIRCGRNSAYAMVRSGQIRAIHIGRAIRVPTSAIRELLEGSGAGHAA